MVSKAFLVCWVPVATLLAAYIASQYVAFREKKLRATKRERLLDDLLQRPDDLLFLADSCSDGQVFQVLVRQSGLKGGSSSLYYYLLKVATKVAPDMQEI